MQAPARYGRGRTPTEIKADRLRQLQALASAPAWTHAHLDVGELAPVVRGVLDAAPALRAQLEDLDAPRRLLTVLCALAHALDVPVALVGGMYDANGKAPRHAGNGWGHLCAAIDGVAAYSARTARRRWDAVELAGGGVRKERNDRRKTTPGDTWTAPARKRRNGATLPSAGRQYAARRIRSVAYLSAVALRRSRRDELTQALGDALRKALPRAVRRAGRIARRGRGLGWAVRLSNAQRAQIAQWKREKAAAQRIDRRVQAQRYKASGFSLPSPVISKSVSRRASESGKDPLTGGPPLPGPGGPGQSRPTAGAEPPASTSRPVPVPKSAGEGRAPTAPGAALASPPTHDVPPVADPGAGPYTLRLAARRKGP